MLSIAAGVLIAVGTLAWVLWPALRPGPLPVPEPEAAGDATADAPVRVVCPVCGPRPEPDARVCSTCGRTIGRE